MTKLLRKYNKWLLVVGGTVLLVTWLVQGTAGQFNPDPAKRIIATAMGQKIRANEITQSELEFRALDAYARGALRYQAGAENATHFFLLVREAEALGLVGEAGDGAEYIPELAKTEAQFAVMSNPQYKGFAQYVLNDANMMAGETAKAKKFLEDGKHIAASRNGLTDKQLELALAKLRGVVRMVSAYERGARMSDVQMTDEVTKFQTRVSFDAVIIPADKVTNVPEPTAEQVNDLFNKYKDVRKGEGEYGFGYLLPKRVKIEFLTLSKAAISAAVELDPVAVSKYWQQNRTEFKGEFAAEKTKVETKLREEKVNETLNEADRLFRAKVKTVVRKLDSANGVKKLPADWESLRPKMEDLAKAIAAETTTIKKMPLPTVEVLASRYTPVEKLTTLGGLGAARFSVGTAQGRIDELVGQTYELSKSSVMGLQVGIPFEMPLSTQSGDKIYITILDAKTENPPDTLDEVRDAVAADAKRLAQYEKLKTDASTYMILATTDGLDGVANLFAAPVAPGSPEGTKPVPLPIDKRVVISKANGDQSHPRYDSQSLRDDVLNHVQLLGFDSKATPENLAQRVLTSPLPKEQGLAVIIITGFEPVSIEDMRQMGDVVATNLATRELRDAMKEKNESSPFSFKSVKERMAYQSVEKSDAETDAAKEDAKKTEEKKGG